MFFPKHKPYYRVAIMKRELVMDGIKYSYMTKRKVLEVIV